MFYSSNSVSFEKFDEEERVRPGKWKWMSRVN
jgi:hypothetical protein